jgi:hypothetical protein
VDAHQHPAADEDHEPCEREHENLARDEVREARAEVGRRDAGASEEECDLEANVPASMVRIAGDEAGRSDDAEGHADGGGWGNAGDEDEHGNGQNGAAASEDTQRKADQGAECQR